MAKVSDIELSTWVRADVDACDLHYSETIEPRAIDSLQRFLGDKDYYKSKWPRLSERSSLVMTDVADTIYWVLPSLMRVFFGGKDIISIEGRTPEDDPTAMRELVNWQISRKNKGFLKFYRWFFDALIFGFAIVKPRWERKEEEVTETVPMTPEQFLEFDPAAEGVKLISAEEQPDGTFAVTVERMKVTENYPVLDNVPISEFGYLPESDEVAKIPCCYHKRLMSRSQIKEKVRDGVWSEPPEEAFAEARYQYEGATELDQFLDDDVSSLGRDGASGYDKSRELYWVYEVYGRYDVDDDGISEHMIVTMIGNSIILREENPLKRPPFAVVSPYPGLYQIAGYSIDDMIGELQDLKTAMVRQVVLNIANNNDRQALVDEDAVNSEDLRDNKRYIRFSSKGNVKRASDVISYMPEAPMSGMTMSFIEWIDSVKENRTGVTKYNQGLDASSLNKTATGITAIMGAANQRIEMIARMFAETGVVDLFRILVEMNNLYVDNEQVLRLTEGKHITVRPDDLDGAYDLDIAAGIGAGQRQEATQNMMLLLNTVYPAMAASGVPPTPENVLEAVSTLVSQMGYKDTSKLVPTIEQLQQLMQGMQEQQMQQEQMP